MMSGKGIDMLRGPLAWPMLWFALPLIASGLLQQSFNSIDVAIVGRFAGSDALAAVGSNGPVIGLLVNLFMGLGVGVNVVIANYIGQRNSAGVRASVSASSVLAMICGVVMVCITLAASRPLLTALDTPSSCLDDAVRYLRIYALGMPMMLIFNLGSAVLRSVGDTRRPFYALVAGGIANVGFNILFVVGMGMGVAGVAWGTVLSNCVCALAVIVFLVREQGDIRLDIRHISPLWAQMGKICRVGFPAGLQSVLFSISNVFILSALNSYGAMAAAGSAAAINFELYCYFVINAFGQTAVAFISQNYGAGQYDRCQRVLRISLLYSASVALVLNLIVRSAPYFFLSAFTSDPGVMHFGAERIASVLVFQFVACYYEMTGSAMRALGYAMTPTVITVFGTCVLRLLWVGFVPRTWSFGTLLLIYPITWAATDILMYVAFSIIRHRLTRKGIQVVVPAEATARR